MSSTWTPEGFKEDCELVSKVFNEMNLSDGPLNWFLKESPLTGEPYLELDEVVHRHSKPVEESTDINGPLTTEEDELVDETIIEDSSTSIIPSHSVANDEIESKSVWRFWIAYSHTWRLPVLWFTVQHPDRTLFSSRDEVVKVLVALHHQNEQSNELSSWEFVSLDEHPATGLPAYYLHPCRTSERLKLLHLVDENGEGKAQGETLLTWMTLVLPSVGLCVKATTFQRARSLIRIYHTRSP